MKIIQEFSDEELIDELMARYDDVVISARRVLTNSDAPEGNRQRWWSGDTDVCIGLAQGLIHILTDKAWNGSQHD